MAEHDVTARLRARVNDVAAARRALGAAAQNGQDPHRMVERAVLVGAGSALVGRLAAAADVNDAVRFKVRGGRPVHAPI